jgi:hypothetical protein
VGEYGDKRRCMMDERKRKRVGRTWRGSMEKKDYIERETKTIVVC